MRHHKPPHVPATRVWLDGEALQVPEGSGLAAILLRHRPAGWSRSVDGGLRAPLCGMGICFECRVTVDGKPRLACMTPCRDGMTVQTDLGSSVGDTP